MPTLNCQTIDELSEADIQLLLQRGKNGDPTAGPTLRQLLDARPDLRQQCADLVAVAEKAWINLIAGQDYAQREALTSQLQELKEELAGPNPSPLERLLAAQVADCVLQINAASVAAAAVHQVGSSKDLRREELAERRQDAAGRRYLASLKMLATVRKLLRPTASPVEIATRLNRRAPPSGARS